MIFYKLKYLNFEDVETIKSNYRRDIIIKDEIINIKHFENLSLETMNNELQEQNKKLLIKNTELKVEVDELNEYSDMLNDETTEQNYSPIDDFIEKKYKVIKDKIYTDKREIKGIKIPIRLNDLIQPKVYAVEKYMSQFKLTTKNFNNISLVANDIASWTWTSDRFNFNKDDYYLFVSESLALKNIDCEKMSYILASCFPKHVGVAYGVSTYGDDKPFGHAWNIFIFNNKLYVSDSWYGDKALIEPIEETIFTHIPYFIITKNCTYFVQKGEFGIVK